MTALPEIAIATGLLERVKDPSDKAAWNQFVTLYLPLIRCWARHATSHPADAEDLVQEFFLDLYWKLPAFEDNGSGRFRGWLRTQFGYTRLTWLRGRGKEIPLLETVPDRAAADVSEQEEDLEYWRCLFQAAKKTIQPEFSDNAWKAFEALTAGRKAAEVAANLGMTPAAVYMAKSRILARLRQELDGFID